MSNLLESLKKFRGSQYNFNTLLIIVAVYIFAILPFVHHEITEKILFIVFYVLLFSNSLPFLIRNRRFGLILGFTIMPLIMLLLEFFLSAYWVKVLIDIFVLIYLFSLIWIFLSRTFSKGTMDSNRVQGAILAYLLLALAFAFIYHLIYLALGPEAIRGLLVYNRREFVYFSMSTLTTIGYGDITPHYELARSLANLEALAGQLYPAVLIARLVSLENTHSK